MKKRLPTFILIIVFLLGLSLLLYPTVSNYWNSFHQSRVVSSYVETVTVMNDYEYDEIWDAAVAYNKDLAAHGNKWNLNEQEIAYYESMLKVSETSGVMGYIEIRKINCFLPIYHGTDDAVIQVAVGHIEGSSLPTGGKSTHCVLSSHRGLPSAQLFSRLDQLKEGDTFTIRVLDEKLTYEVDQIRIVLPEEMDTLYIEEGKDLCTLVTCTPYGVNSHRLLVRGHRIDADESDLRVSADAMQIDTLIVAVCIAVPLLLILLTILLLKTRKRKK